MEETQPLPQSELPLCDSLIIWVSTRGRGGPRGGGEVPGAPSSPQVSLRSKLGHLRRGPGALPSASPVALDRESATCRSRGRRVCV